MQYAKLLCFKLVSLMQNEGEPAVAIPCTLNCLISKQKFKTSSCYNIYNYYLID